MHIIINDLAIIGAKYLYLLVAVLAAIYFVRQPRKVQKELILFGIIVLPVIYLMARVASLFYFDPRPFVVGHFSPLIPHAPDNGFPSDHTVLSAAIATIITPYNQRLSLILWLLTIVVGLSRVYVGVHHIVDVLGSMIIAALVGWLSYNLVVKRVTQLPWYKRIGSNYFPR